jgi:formylglycine-generating enzyme required for sulfatase activity
MFAFDRLPPPFGWAQVPAGTVSLQYIGALAPEPPVMVAAFTISTYPITNAQFALFIEAGGYSESACWGDAGWRRKTREGWMEPRYWGAPGWCAPDHPVVGVSWYEAVAFCRWLSEESGQAIDLPTIYQWQRAAQGDDGREFPWGSAEPDGDRCNWQRDHDETTAVTRFPLGRSPFGVMDMSGNIWEWCAERWNGSQHGELRLLRGGSWSSDSPLSLRAAHNNPHDPNARKEPHVRDSINGFRIVRG